VYRKQLKSPLDEYRSFNAAVETFFKTIKAELVWRRPWETRRQAETAIFQYINDGVDAPPGGITMCQNDSRLNCHIKEEHPWKMLA
jgi:putative transposase